MRGKKHPDKVRSQALAALLEGQGITEVAKAYNLPTSTVRDLKSMISSDEFAKVRAKKEAELAELIEGHLQASLKAAVNIAKQTENAAWLNTQSADDLGVFYGVLTDKSVRILEAAENAKVESEQDWPEVVR